MANGFNHPKQLKKAKLKALLVLKNGVNLAAHLGLSHFTRKKETKSSFTAVPLKISMVLPRPSLFSALAIQVK